jgi:hypothetical protein
MSVTDWSIETEQDSGTNYRGDPVEELNPTPAKEVRVPA